MTAPVGYLVSQYPATSHTFIRREIDALRARGLAIDTFSIRRPNDAELRAERDRTDAAATYYLLPMPALRLLAAHTSAVMTSPWRYVATLALALRHRVPGTRAMIWALFHFAEAIVLAQELRRRRTPRLHNHFANSGATVGLLATHFLRLPWSLTLHGISETDYPAGLLLADKIAAADHVACVSWFGRAQAMRLVPPDQWQKLAIVRCGVDTAALARFKGRSGPGAELTIICVGRLSAEKAQAGLLEAFAALIARGAKARLILVGDGPGRSQLDREVERLGLARRVDFVGRLDETSTLAAIARADVLVLPSFMEGLPVVLIEAMALGVPVVAARIAGVPELVTDGAEGLLFTPANWSELADRLAAFVGDEALRVRCAEAARTKVAREFDIHAAVAPLAARFASDLEPGHG